MPYVMRDFIKQFDRSLNQIMEKDVNILNKQIKKKEAGKAKYFKSLINDYNKITKEAYRRNAMSDE